jgi:hypothetical protein
MCAVLITAGLLSVDSQQLCQLQGFRQLKQLAVCAGGSAGRRGQYSPEVCVIAGIPRAAVTLSREPEPAGRAVAAAAGSG